MKIIVGLGNPGDKYKNTRHNAGFMAVDFYLEKREAIRCESKFKGLICEMHFTAHTGSTAPVKVFFVKPQTFMNKSGEAVKEIVQFYKVDVKKDLLIVHDEVDLKFGFFKLAFDSRGAGHNGVQNIIDELGTQEFSRLRIGIETRMSRHESPTEDYVLQSFSKEELEQLHADVLPKASEEIEKFIVSSKEL